MSTNDPNNANVRLRVSIDIDVLFAFEPRRINMGRQRREEFKPVTINAIGTKLADVKILSATLTNPENEKYFNINIEDTGSGENRAIQLTVEPTEHIPIGRIGDRINVKTNLDEAKNVEVFLTGEVLGPIDVNPRSLVLRATDDDTPFTGSIRLTPADNLQFKVLSVECPDDNLEIAVLPSESDNSIVIETSYPNDGQTTRFRSEIVIRTDVPEQQEFNVPVFVQQTRRRPDLTRQTR